MRIWRPSETGLWVFDDDTETVTTSNPKLAPKTLTIEEVAKAVAAVSVNSLTLRQFLLLCALYEMRTRDREFSGYLPKPFGAAELSDVSGYLGTYSNEIHGSGIILTFGEFSTTGYETALLCVAMVKKWIGTLTLKELPEPLTSPFSFVRQQAQERLQKLQHNPNLESNEDQK